ncbi:MULTISPECIES: hypothetical protein [Nocardia]|uniref:hypothetical protein n=1 Tax=Nocardia TaxID=1817 RepID=UPI000A77BAF9|nr:hypothetical protein [Nocardia beijingensis]
MTTEPQGPLDLWKSTQPLGPHQTPGAPESMAQAPVHHTPQPHRTQATDARTLIPHPQPQPGPYYPQHRAAPPQYPPMPYPQPAQTPLVNVVQHNATLGAGPIVVRSAFPHGLHLVLSLVTCGMWLPIWLIHYLISGNR